LHEWLSVLRLFAIKSLKCQKTFHHEGHEENEENEEKTFNSFMRFMVIKNSYIRGKYHAT